MLDQIESIFRKQNVLFHKNQEIAVAAVADQKAGIDLASRILYEIVDRKTVIYLSGGSYKSLYERLAKDERLVPGAVGLIDERFGPPFHENSNQLMIRDSGLIRYLQIRDIPFYPILQLDKSREETAEAYDGKFRSLQAVFPKHIGLLGIGPDGHTAGMPALNSKLKNQKSKIYDTFDLVTEYDDKGEVYGERVTMSFLGLSMLDFILVMAFGSAKQATLDLMFGEGSQEDIPARFFKRPEIAKKTLLITDQRV
jgi:6-phosphogluconolactonase/glucosamine-6-phosphate isomerase/deaminase